MRIASTRPVGASRVFAGKPIETVLRQLPALYSVCAMAQGTACARAIEQATGVAASARQEAWRALLLHAEATKEHLWRLLLDWPRALDPGCDPAPALIRLAPVMKALLGLRQAAEPARPFALDGAAAAPGEVPPQPLRDLADAAAQALGTAPGDWLARVTDGGGFTAWAAAAETPAARLARMLSDAGLAGLGANPVPALPALGRGALAQRLGASEAERFVAAPIWHGHCCETSPLARSRAQPLIADLAAVYGNGLLPRLAALLLELARDAQALPEVAAALQRGSDTVAAPMAATCRGVGLGCAEAARGLLVHRVEVAGARVLDYRILAPTEWNFHPEGVVAAGLAAIARGAGNGRIERDARLYITAVDPCVDYRLSLC